MEKKKKKKAGPLRSKLERKRKAKKAPHTGIVAARGERVQAERSVQLGQMMPRLHKQAQSEGALWLRQWARLWGGGRPSRVS